jgi:microcystin-dependent protein
MARTRFTVKEGISVADDNNVGGYPLVPAGSVIAFAGSTAPEGWLLCDGRSTGILRTTYANLFAVLGTSYGSGDGSTTFNLPDMRSRVPIGAGAGTGLTSRTLATTGGAESVVVVSGNLPTHVHSIAHDHANVTSTGQSVGHTHSIDPPNTTSTGTSVNHSHDTDPANTTSAGENNSHYHGPDSGYHEHSYKVAQTATAGTNRAILTGTGSGATTGGINYGYAGATTWEAYSHTHNTNIGATTSSGHSADHNHDTNIGPFDSAGASVGHTHDVDLPNFTGDSGNGGFANTALGLMNPFLALNYIIKY